MYLGPANADGASPGRNAMREELVEMGGLVPVEVEGVQGESASSSGTTSSC
jgi:hypothetical protein